MKPLLVGWMYTIRNWRRNILPIIIVGLAGFMVIYTLFLSAGRPYHAQLERRAYAGGDLLVSTHIFSAPEHSNYLGNRPPVLQWNSQLSLNPVANLDTSSARWGTFAAEQSTLDAEKLVEALQAHPDVAAVTPLQVMPAFIVEGQRRLPVVLRIRPWQEQPYRSFVQDSDEVQAGVILPGFRPEVARKGQQNFGYCRFNGDLLGFYRGNPIAAEWPTWRLGDEIELALPERGKNGKLDLVHTSTIVVSVKGLYEYPTGTIDWYKRGLRLEGLTHNVSGRPLDPNPTAFPRELLHMVPLEVVVSPQLWSELSEQVGAEPLRVGFAVQLKNLADLRNTSRELRELAAPAALFSVPAMAEYDSTAGVAHVEVPPGDLRATWAGMNHLPVPPVPPPPAWARWAILSLVGLLAVVLVGGILDVLIAEQRREFIVLRVMGYSRWQLTAAVFAQIASIVGLGLIVTLVVIILPVLWQANQPGLTLVEFLEVPLQLLLVLLFSGLLISVILTANAIRRLLGRTMWEVLRS